MTEKHFDITGMSCAACSARVEKAAGSVSGVQKAEVNLLTNSMTCVYDEAKTDENVIMAAVRESGYGASVRTKAGSGRDYRKVVDSEAEKLRKRLISSLVILVPLMYVSMGHMAGLPLPGFMDGPFALALSEAVLSGIIMAINNKYYTNGIKSLLMLHPNMDSLVATGSLASYIYGIYTTFLIFGAEKAGDADAAMKLTMSLYFEGAGMIVSLVDIGKYLEARSKSKTTGALERLVDMTPETATVIRDGEEKTVRASDVKAGDIVAVRPGGRIPADGTVTEGETAVSEAALTGESMPCEKVPGSRVYASSVNETGFIRFRAEKVGDETSFAKIITLVEKASSSKAPIARVADRVSGIFVPAVMGISLLTFIIWKLSGAATDFALTCAISVLVISCPCALGLATPVAIMVGMGKGAENGILIKSAEVLENLGKTDAAVFDKTGTLTEGKPYVTSVTAYGCGEKRVLEIAAALESGSEHPLAKAVLKKAEKEGIMIPKAEGFESLTGFGVTGIIDGERYHVGSRRLCESLGIDPGEEGAGTALYVIGGGSALGRITCGDRIRESSAGAVASLKDLGIESFMVTGDGSASAEAAAAEIGDIKVFVGVMPEGKAERVSMLKKEGRHVAMVGDGINDAPALATADTGIAVGSGTDVALECADIVLEGNDPMDVYSAVYLSREVMKKIKQNLFWAFFYNCLGIPLAAGALYPAFGLQLSPVFASLAMSLSSVTVVMNALSLRKIKLKDCSEGKKEEKVMTETIKVGGMMCMHCVAHVKEALEKTPGVVSADVDLGKGEAVVVFSAPATLKELENAVVSAGYEVVK